MTAHANGVDVLSLPPVRAVLAPVDGSKLSYTALLVADELAERLGIEIHVLTAVPHEGDVPAGQQRLAALLPPGRPVHPIMAVDPDPANAICETSIRIDKAIICMATHGRGRSSALLGSVSTAVIARSRGPLVLAGRSLGHASGLLWEDEPIRLAKFRGGGVVVCLDETEASVRLLEMGHGWAARLGEPLIALTVAELLPPPVDGGEVHRLFGPDGDVEAFLNKATAPLRAQGFDVLTRALYDPISPADGVESYLSGSPGAMVLAGWRPRSPLTRLVSRNTTATVVRHSPSPVLVVPLND
jgi:nucleotide-binding universal stress UspA family protein